MQMSRIDLNRMKQRRKDLGLSQDVLAALVHCDEKYIGRIERGERQPAAALEVKIEAALKKKWNENEIVKAARGEYETIFLDVAATVQESALSSALKLGSWHDLLEQSEQERLSLDARCALPMLELSALSGTYDQVSIETGESLGLLTELRYIRGRTLNTRGQDRTKQGQVIVWEGQITMNEHLPSLGTGVYGYPGRPDCGTHEIQVREDGKLINVCGVNTSHPGQRPRFALLWRRRTTDVQILSE